MSVVIESHCFPCIDYFKKVIKGKHIKIEAYESFQKMSFRNRYVLSGANGLQTLTIPVAGGREQKKLITEVEIDYSVDWAIKHWRSITSGYSKAPFFDYYADDIRTLLFSKEILLLNFNMEILGWLLKRLKINVVIEFTDSFKSVYNNEFDFRNQLLPKNYINDVCDWRPKYPQVFEDRLGFQPNLSILDLLFCQGPNAGELVQNNI